MGWLKRVGLPAIGLLLFVNLVIRSDYGRRIRRLEEEPEGDVRPKIYTFHESVAPDHDDLLMVWKRKWFEAGWNPVVLTLQNARRHPNYKELMRLLPAGQGARCLEWLAVASMGGGWLAEYDVFPLHDFIEDGIELPYDGALTIWENVVPSLVSGSATEFTRGAMILAENMEENTHSDILALVHLSRSTQYRDAFHNRREVLAGHFDHIDERVAGNWPDCHIGKRAVHFPSTQNGGSIVQWLDAWDASHCKKKDSQTEEEHQAEVVRRTSSGESKTLEELWSEQAQREREIIERLLRDDKRQESEIKKHLSSAGKAKEREAVENTLRQRDEQKRRQKQVSSTLTKEKPHTSSTTMMQQQQQQQQFAQLDAESFMLREKAREQLMVSKLLGNDKQAPQGYDEPVAEVVSKRIEKHDIKRQAPSRLVGEHPALMEEDKKEEPRSPGSVFHFSDEEVSEPTKEEEEEEENAYTENDTFGTKHVSPEDVVQGKISALGDGQDQSDSLPSSPVPKQKTFQMGTAMRQSQKSPQQFQKQVEQRLDRMFLYDQNGDKSFVVDERVDGSTFSRRTQQQQQQQQAGRTSGHASTNSAVDGQRHQTQMSGTASSPRRTNSIRGDSTRAASTTQQGTMTMATTTTTASISQSSTRSGSPNQRIAANNPPFPRVLVQNPGGSSGGPQATSSYKRMAGTTNTVQQRQQSRGTAEQFPRQQQQQHRNSFRESNAAGA